MTEPVTDPAGDSRRAPSLFLEREGYRRRRLTDAARMLPLLGAALFLIPLLWPVPDADAGQAGVSTSRAIIYIFLVWALLIAVSGVLSANMRYWNKRENQERKGQG